MNAARRFVLPFLALAAIPVGLAVAAGTKEAQPTQPTQAAPRAAPADTETGRPAIDPQADALLRKMSNYLGQQKEFSLTTEGTVQVITKDGQKIDAPFDGTVVLERPNKLRATRKGPDADLTFIYDGKSFAIYGKAANMYAKSAAPPTIDKALDDARDRLGIEAPAADLLYTDSYAGLMKGVTSAKYVGKSEINGAICDQVAVRGKNADWQIWIMEGDRPVPCRYVISTRDMKGQPEFRADLKQWNFEPKVTDKTFAFVPPEGAQRIEFLEAKQQKQTAKAKKTGGAE